MSTYKFAQIPGNETVASLTYLLVSAWFTVAAGAILAEPSVEQQARAAHARTPEVNVRMISAQTEPDARFQIQVVAKRGAARVS